MNRSKTIVLCADDFGLNACISQGILQLIRMHRLSAVSCMVTAPAFRLHAEELLALKKQVQTGLHFNLTEGKLLTHAACFGLKELLMKSHLRRIDLRLIADEFNAQLNQFIQHMDCLPDFIDGHQHVHQFPGIRQVLLTQYKLRLRQHHCTIRATYPAISHNRFQLKTTLLALTGGYAMHRQLNQLGIPHNRCFAGVYDFSENRNYRALFRYWLERAPTDTLIMCHPAQGKNPNDTIANARQLEMDYLMSDDFVKDTRAFHINIKML